MPRKYAAYGKLLKYYRELANLKIRPPWTQARIAKALGVSPRTYAGWENGEKLPSSDDLINFVAVLDLSEEEVKTLYRSVAQIPPEIINLPFQRNLLFTGRERQLENLDQLLKENNRVALSGLGGLGKTQLAFEYACDHYPDMYRVVLWVNAVDEETLQASYADLAEPLKLPERDELKLHVRIEAVTNWLKMYTNWLLIMDNADDLQLAHSFFPVPLQGHILLTTRSPIVGNIARKIEIEKMEPEEGQLFLLRRSHPSIVKATLDDFAADTREAALDVVDLLDGHPLALDQAGAYIEEGISFTEYIKLYQQARSDLLRRRGSLNSEHPDSFVVTFELCFAKSHKQYPRVIEIAGICAFLHPDAIPDELFQSYDPSNPGDTVVINARTALLRYSLIKRNTEEETISMHRLVQAVLIDKIPHDYQKRFKHLVVDMLALSFPQEISLKKSSRHERLLSHVLVCARWTDEELPPLIGVAWLFYRAGLYFSTQQQDSSAETLLERALSLYEQHLGAEHNNIPEVLDRLATVYINQSKYEQAEPLLVRAHSIMVNHFGPEHPLTAKSLCWLAALYDGQHKYEQAEPLLVRAHSIYEQHLGPEHPDTLNVLCMQAGIYLMQGKYEQAEPLFRHVLSICEENLGTLSMDTLMVFPLSGISTIMTFQGRHKQAEALVQRVLSILEPYYGATHPYIEKVKTLNATIQQALEREAETAAPDVKDESSV